LPTLHFAPLSGSDSNLGREPNPSKPIKGKRAGSFFSNSLKKGTHKKGGESRVFSQGTAANMSWAAAKKDPFL
jgi:hypothetical protein